MVSEAEIDAVIRVAMERGGGFGREDIRAELEAAERVRETFWQAAERLGCCGFPRMCETCPMKDWNR